MNGIKINTDNELSVVEQKFLYESGKRPIYPHMEHVTSIEVENVYSLSQLAAFRFLEWALAHPKGIIALPTGRTPEYFIKTLDFLRSSWTTVETQKELNHFGFNSPSFPDLSGLTFVM